MIENVGELNALAERFRGVIFSSGMIFKMNALIVDEHSLNTQTLKRKKIFHSI